MASESPQITVTHARVVFFLALAAVVALGWNVFSYLKDGEIKDLQQDARIERVEGAGERFETGINKLTDKTDELKESIVRLTTVIEQTQVQDRADFYFEGRPQLQHFASESK